MTSHHSCIYAGEPSVMTGIIDRDRYLSNPESVPTSLPSTDVEHEEYEGMRIKYGLDEEGVPLICEDTLFTYPQEDVIHYIRGNRTPPHEVRRIFPFRNFAGGVVSLTVLTDTGASLTTISPRVVKLLGLEKQVTTCKPIRAILSVDNGIPTIITEMVLINTYIEEFNEWIRWGFFIVEGLNDDVIFGMDLLVAYDAMVHCRLGMVVFTRTQDSIQSNEAMIRKFKGTKSIISLITNKSKSRKKRRLKASLQIHPSAASAPILDSSDASDTSDEIHNVNDSPEEGLQSTIKSKNKGPPFRMLTMEEWMKQESERKYGKWQLPLPTPVVKEPRRSKKGGHAPLATRTIRKHEESTDSLEEEAKSIATTEMSSKAEREFYKFKLRMFTVHPVSLVSQQETRIEVFTEANDYTGEILTEPNYTLYNKKGIMVLPERVHIINGKGNATLLNTKDDTIILPPQGCLSTYVNIDATAQLKAAQIHVKDQPCPLENSIDPPPPKVIEGRQELTEDRNLSSLVYYRKTQGSVNATFL